ncbi:EpsI family protein [Oxalobacteraceae bacterium GrIS 1.11]
MKLSHNSLTQGVGSQTYTDKWITISDTRKIVTAGKRALTVRQTLWQSGGRRTLVWRWYRQGGVETSNTFLVKLLLAKAKLWHTAEDGADIIVSMPYEEPAPPPEAAMRDFLTAILPVIERGLRDVGQR